MKTEYDPEFRFRPEQEYFPGEEFGRVSEQAAPANEDTEPAPAIQVSFENNENADTTAEKPEDKHRRLKKMLLKPVVAITATAAIASAAGGYSLLGGGSVSSGGSGSGSGYPTAEQVIAELNSQPGYLTGDLSAFDQELMEWVSGTDIYEHYSQYVEMADTSFPTLSNLEPNGYVPGYGVIDEDFIMIYRGDGSDAEFIWAGARYGETLNGEFYPEEIVDDPSMRYDRETNTLTLDNCNAGRLVANMMGNGFKIKLVGNNTIEGLLVWGFHYGGSVTFVGDGSLTITKEGILLLAEMSESCVMIDRGVTLDITSNMGHAILVDNVPPGSSIKGIYYLEPLKMSDGAIRDFAINTKEDGSYDPDRGVSYFTRETNRTDGFVHLVIK